MALGSKMRYPWLYGMLGCFGFGFTVVPLLYFIYSLEWTTNLLIDFIRLFGVYTTATTINWFHYYLSWTLIPCFIMALHLETRSLPLSRFITGSLGCAFGCDCVCNFVLAGRGNVQPQGPRQRNTAILVLYLLANYALLAGWLFTEQHTWEFVAWVFLQALGVPIAYCYVSADVNSVHPLVLELYGVSTAVGSIFFFSHALPAVDYNPWAYLSIGMSNSVTTCMFGDSMVLWMSSLVYVGLEPSAIAPSKRFLCVILCLAPPLAPLGLCLFLSGGIRDKHPKKKPQ
jgi:hypothetical protein